MEAGTLLLNRYRVLELIGRGAMSEVWQAMDLRRHAIVAIKLLREDLAEDPEFLRRFSQEANALAQLDHPNIVRFYSFERQGNLAFLVLDFIQGITLRRYLLEQNGPLSLEEATAIFRQIAGALQYAHDTGIVHRDIKPGNILISSDKRVYISDFGIAKVIEGATLATMAVGTPAYMSPEQILGQKMDHRTDIYSLGVVLYEMVTGRRPFTGEEEGLTGTSTIERVRQAHIHKDMPDPHQWNPALTTEIVEVLRKALAKNPEDRWPTVIDMLHAWEQATNISPTPTEPGSEVTVFALPPITISQPSILSRATAWMRQRAPASYVVAGMLFVIVLFIAFSSVLSLGSMVPPAHPKPPTSVSPPPIAGSDSPTAGPVTQTLEAQRQYQAVMARLTQEAQYTADALATQQAHLSLTREAKQTPKAQATREALSTLTRQAERTFEAKVTEQAVYSTLTRQAVRTVATQPGRATPQAPSRCFRPRLRHWEKSSSGKGEIGGIVYDRTNHPFIKAIIRVEIVRSGWFVEVPVDSQGVYNYCCLDMNPHNKHVVRLIGENIRTLETYEFHLFNINQNRVLIDFFEEECQ